uniref:Uncharacterized protein n=1 Tax=Arundo donax TaxID=35708 RepID=A0A0A9DC30_ARUDO
MNNMIFISLVYYLGPAGMGAVVRKNRD